MKRLVWVGASKEDLLKFLDTKTIHLFLPVIPVCTIMSTHFNLSNGNL
jgi:hypothetical protein